MKFWYTSFHKTWLRPILTLTALAAVVVGVGRFGSIQPEPRLSGLKPFSLSGYQRLLILAPHCDDETLGAAGLIQASVRAGIEVRVVIATNGDGYRFATMEEYKRLYASPADFIRMGALRQRESLAALKLLGMPEDKVIFLGYPDRGSPALWNERWSAANPYRSPYSTDTRSPYELTYNKNSVYAGEDYLADLISIMETYRPDLVIYPNPEDVHPDHWGLNVFTQLALTEMEHRDLSFHPAKFTYLVHRPDFPVEGGYKPGEVLAPPEALLTAFPDWYHFDLSQEEESLKGAAVKEYRSQLRLSGKLLESFVRTNELLAPVESLSALKTAVKGDLTAPAAWIDEDGEAIPPVQRDPVHDSLLRDAVWSGDLTALYAAQTPDGLLRVCGELAGSAERELTYVVRLKTLSSGGVQAFQARTGKAERGWEMAQTAGKTFCAEAPLASLGNPWAVFVSVESLGIENSVIDQTGWKMLLTAPGASQLDRQPADGKETTFGVEKPGPQEN